MKDGIDERAGVTESQSLRFSKHCFLKFYGMFQLLLLFLIFRFYGMFHDFATSYATSMILLKASSHVH